MEEFEGIFSNPFENFPEPATTVCVNGYDRDDLKPCKPWASRLDHTELVEMARRQRREVLQDCPRKPCKDGWMGPVPPEARDNEATLLRNFRWWFYPCKKGSMPPFRYDGAIDQWRKTVLAFSGDRVYITQRDDPMSTPVPRLSSYEGVEVMIVARPLRGAEGLGAAAVGKGHRNTTYTGLRGPEAAKGKGRRRERDRERAQLYMARDPMHRTGYTESDAAPGVEPKIRDPAGLMGVKTANSPARWRYPQLHLGRDVVVGGHIPLSPAVVMRSLLNPPGNLTWKFLRILMIAPLSLHATLQFLPNLEGRLCCKDSTC